MDEKRTPVRRQGPPPGPRGWGMPMSLEKPKNIRRTLLRLLTYLRNRKLLLLLVFLMMLLSSSSQLASNYFLKPLINNYILPGDFTGLLGALVILAGIYLVGMAAAYLQSRLMVTLAQRTTNAMRRELFIKMQALPLKFFDTHTHGDVMSRFTNDLDNVQMALEQSLVQLISGVITFAGAIIIMILLSPLLFVITFLVLALMFFLSGKLAGTSGKFFIAQQKNLGSVNGYIEEMVDGLKVVKVFNHEGEAIRAFKQRNEAYRQAAAEANFYAGVTMPVMMNLNNIGYAATALFGGILAVVSSFDIGSLAAFLQYTRQVGFPVQMITKVGS